MKFMFCLLGLVCSLNAVAQKGNWYIGGIGGFRSQTDKSSSGYKSESNYWAFGPEAGTFLSDNFQLGLYLGMSGSSGSDDGGNASKSFGFRPTLYGRRFFKITDNFSLFAGMYMNVGSGTSTNSPSGSEYKSSGFALRLGVGIAYALSPRFTAIGQYGLLGYETVSYTSDGIDAGSVATFDFGVNTIGSSTLPQGNGSGAVFNIGLYYTFKKND